MRNLDLEHVMPQRKRHRKKRIYYTAMVGAESYSNCYVHLWTNREAALKIAKEWRDNGYDEAFVAKVTIQTPKRHRP